MSSEEAQRFQRRLQGANQGNLETHPQDADHEANLSQDRSPIQWMSSWNWLLNIHATILKAFRKSSQPTDTDKALPSHTSDVQPPPAREDDPDALRLLLCVENGGKSRVCEECIPNHVNEDRKLFAFLRDHYESIPPRRGFSTWLTLKEVRTISPIKVSILSLLSRASPLI